VSLCLVSTAGWASAGLKGASRGRVDAWSIGPRAAWEEKLEGNPQRAK
jgi:hypothetical protein